MKHRSIRGLVMSLVLATAVLACSEAKAGWWHWGCWGHHAAWASCSHWGHGYWGGYGCYTPCYPAYTPCYTACTPCYSTCYSTCYTPCYRSCGWGGCYRGWYGARCFQPCGVCGCTTAYCGCSCCDGVLMEGTPVLPNNTPESPTPATGAPPTTVPGGMGEAPTGQQTSMSPGSAILNVHVPDNARVTVNGVATRSVGNVRRYISQDLAMGFRYTYEVRAEAEINGRTVAETKTVHLRGGDSANLAFRLNPAASPATSLTLHVPKNARVYLAGNEMKGTGTVRTFRTTKLDHGKTWSDYAVRVVVDRNGEDQSKEETIALQAGEQRELTFDFDVDMIASAR